jgi:hypothetical protein
MNTAIAYIDISRPSGRKIVSEIENRRAVKMEYPLPPVGKTYTVEESFAKVEKILNDFYGTNYKI